MAKVQIPCNCCKGTGKIEVTGVYLQTLAHLQRMTAKRAGDNFVVANREYPWFQCSPTALSNRLKWLEQRGLATVEMFGRQKRYRSTSKPQTGG